MQLHEHNLYHLHPPKSQKNETNAPPLRKNVRVAGTKFPGNVSGFRA